MPKYELRLESPVDSQARIISLEAENETAARETVEAQELDLAMFSLLPPEKDVWEVGGPRAAALDVAPGDAVVDMSRWDAYDPIFVRSLGDSYGAHKRAANARLKDWAGRIDLAKNGKVRASNLGPRSLARFLAHHQTEPYQIVEGREVDQGEIDRLQVIRAAQRLTSNPGDWERTLDALREAGVPTAAVTATLSGLTVQKQMDGSNPYVWSSATAQASLHTAYTFDQDTHNYFSSASASEITGTGYSANGVTLSSKTSTYDTATDQSRQSAANVSWTTSTLSATDAVVWINTAGASTTDMVIANVDFGATVTTTAGTFQITWDATGIVVVDVT